MKRTAQKKATVTLSFLLAIAASGCAHAGWKDELAKKLVKTGSETVEAAEQMADEALPMSEAQQRHACGFSPEDTGRVNRLKALAVKGGLKLASQKLQVEDIELPEKIQSPCYAEVRWDYVDKKSFFWAGKVAAATNIALVALDIDHQIEADRLFQKGDEPATQSEFNEIRKSVDEGLDKLREGIKNKEVANETLLAEASGAMQGALTYGAELVGWDQRLIEFMSDNMSWTINRKERVATFKEQAQLVGGTFKSLSNVQEAIKASRTDGLNPVAVQAGQASAQQQDAQFEAQLVAELDL